MTLKMCFRPGTYRVLWEGEGVLSVEGPSQVLEVGAGEITFEYDGTSEVFLSILETDPAGIGAYIHNIQVLRPGAVPGERFTQIYLDEIPTVCDHPSTAPDR